MKDCYNRHLLSGVLVFFLVLGAADVFSENKEFVVLYQFTGMKKEQQKVAQMMLPILPVKLSYEPRFVLEHNDTDQPVPSKRILNIVANKIRSETRGPLKNYTIFDIETWKINLSVDSNIAKQSMEKYIWTVKEMKKILPGYRIGNYGSPVGRDYLATANEIKGKRYYRWTKRNDMLKSLADNLDVFYPSLYTFELDKIDEWVRFAKRHVSESRRLAVKGQPVIAFIWPQYHNKSNHKGKFIGYEFWKVQLETLLEIADGVVIWSNHKGPLNTDSEWFKATRDFLESLNQRGVNVNSFAER
jgi:hypothetical protein